MRLFTAKLWLFLCCNIHLDDYTCKEDGVGDGKNKEVVEAA
jgi:hypothetical protein